MEFKRAPRQSSARVEWMRRDGALWSSTPLRRGGSATTARCAAIGASEEESNLHGRVLARGIEERALGRACQERLVGYRVGRGSDDR